ncbi:GNAT family N-acetyltransferase [Pararobbsia silviterrae]|uniref:N-acetyltransferase n=1 Tax=Pararobbsia silviterrae TaxID=1792498 RepID=A0A494XW16_9BURK|nr:GNAT family N-acetyltransferase [Pararobbsia silviterrae]RKP54803.1 N-acetyltransferase [Pararobbsia silviterrae]
MFAALPYDNDFFLRRATPADFEFAHTLTRSNMLGYYKRHGLVWRSDLFLASWNSSENYVIEWAGMAIGVLRIDQDADALYVHDIHIVSTHRNRGAGTFALQSAHDIARTRRRRTLILRVFVDNPAARLYERLGYRPINVRTSAGSIRQMTRPVDE